MARNGNSDIPGAPGWVKHLLGRIDDRFDVLSHQMQSHGTYVAALEERVRKTESDIEELKREIRSLTPPGGFPAVSEPPPEDAA